MKILNANGRIVELIVLDNEDVRVTVELKDLAGNGIQRHTSTWPMKGNEYVLDKMCIGMVPLRFIYSEDNESCYINGKQAYNEIVAVPADIVVKQETKK